MKKILCYRMCMMIIINCLLLSNFCGKTYYIPYGLWILWLICKLFWKYSWHRALKKNEKKNAKRINPFHWIHDLPVSMGLVWIVFDNKKQFTLHLVYKNQTVISHPLCYPFPWQLRMLSFIGFVLWQFA